MISNLEDLVKHRLGDLIDIQTGKIDSNQAKEGGVYPFFTCAPAPLKIDWPSFDTDAILLSGNNANGVYHIHRYSGKFNAYQRTYVLTTKREHVSLDYVYYFLTLRLNFLQDISQGTATKFLTKRILEDIEVSLPDKLVQDKVALILKSLETKYQINQQMNEILESITQALFKHWFIDFEFPDENGRPYKSSVGEMNDSEMEGIPKGWKPGSFEDIIELKMGLSPRGETYNNIGKGLPLVNGAADFSEGNVKPRKFTNHPTRVCKKGDLLFCIRGTIGNLVYADREYCLGRGVAAITAKSDYCKEFVYCVLSFGLEKLNGIATGSVIKGLSKPDILKYPILLADRNLLKTFHTLLEPIFLRREFLKKENYFLSLIRDSLLPKLMSGKIRVPVEE